MNDHPALNYTVLLIFVPPLLLGCVGAQFTWNKLDKMRQIRGYRTGATVETHVVVDKFQQPPGAYWVSWDRDGRRVRSDQRLNLPEPVWNRYAIGDEIEIVKLPHDDSPYHRQGFFASDGNFAFDYGLLLAEIGMIGLALLGAAITGWLVHRRAAAQKPAEAG